MTLWLLPLLAGAAGGFGFGWIVRGILATRPGARRRVRALPPCEPRGELDLDWGDPRKPRLLITFPEGLAKAHVDAVVAEIQRRERIGDRRVAW